MKPLKTLRRVIELRLQKQSDAVLDSVRQALRTIHHLHDHGCTVYAVCVRGEHVVIDIDQPGEWIHGAIHIRRVRGDHRETIRVAKVMGCQVQWTVTDRPELLSGRAS